MGVCACLESQSGVALKFAKMLGIMMFFCLLEAWCSSMSWPDPLGTKCPVRAQDEVKDLVAKQVKVQTVGRWVGETLDSESALNSMDNSSLVTRMAPMLCMSYESIHKFHQSHAIMSLIHIIMPDAISYHDM